MERNFDLFWNGRIEGRVTDDSGRPVQAWVKLLDAAGSELPGYVQDVSTNVDGSYQFKKIPAGRYKVMIDPITREYRWPAEIQFYASKSNVEDAEFLELSEGPRIAGIDFKVPDLAERSIQVRVTTPNGSPVQNASVCIAYTKTQEIMSLLRRNTAPGRLAGRALLRFAFIATRGCGYSPTSLSVETRTGASIAANQ